MGNLSGFRKAAALALPLCCGALAAEAADIVGTLQEREQFSTLAEAIAAAGLADTLKGPGPYTVFAPTEVAFDQLPQGARDRLLSERNRAQLEDLLKHHIVRGEAYSADELPERLDPMAGGPIDVEVAETGAVLRPEGGRQVAVTEGDIPADNGLIHAVDGVLVPQQLAQMVQGGQHAQQQPAPQPETSQSQRPVNPADV